MKATIALNLNKYRRGLGLTQDKLAEKTGVSRGSINNYENGKSYPTGSKLQKLAKALNVSIDALLRTDGLNHQYKYRAHSSFLQSEPFKSRVSELIEDYANLEKCCGLHQYAPETIPMKGVKGNEPVVREIASQFRTRLGAGSEPFINLFREVEKIGLKVLRHQIDLKDFYGLSAWSVSSGAFVLINTKNSTIERQLFTLAHEIGHLVFHRDEYNDPICVDDESENREEESLANYFASHLLMPKDEFNKILKTVNSITEIKKHFRVSYQVVLWRLDDLGIMPYAEGIKKVKYSYKKKHNATLEQEMELPPALESHDFPMNERFKNLVLMALENEEITESKAAEFLGAKITEVREQRDKFCEPISL